MRFVSCVLALLCGVCVVQGSAHAEVGISIDLSSQRMIVNGRSGSYAWPVSSARSGFVTPRGAYKPYSLQTMHYSRKYAMAPMPHSIFFHGGYAIHGTNSLSELGRPASHGCIRLAPRNAALLFAMVKREGARISISGTPPTGSLYARASTAKRYAVKRAKQRTLYATRYRPAYPMAYAPVRRVAPVRQWMREPGFNYPGYYDN